MIGLREGEGPRATALFKEALHHLGNRQLAIGANVRKQKVDELLAEGVSHLEMRE